MSAPRKPADRSVTAGLEDLTPETEGGLLVPFHDVVASAHTIAVHTGTVGPGAVATPAVDG